MKYTVNLPEANIIVTFPKNIEEIAENIYKELVAKYVGKLVTPEIIASMTKELEFLMANDIVMEVDAKLKFPNS